MDRGRFARSLAQDLTMPGRTRQGIDRVLDLCHWFHLSRPRLVL
ncbi:hypothetical protein [Streptomyces avicenniae]|nr:hypothetical protein [Streptomyces avicenniae]